MMKLKRMKRLGWKRLGWILFWALAIGLIAGGLYYALYLLP
jgi:hypothetical protein